MKKADIVWSRFTDHILDCCEHPTTLKDTIRELRMLEVDLNELKRATSSLLELHDSIERMTTPIFQQFLVLLGNPTAKEQPQPCKLILRIQFDNERIIKW